MLRWHPSPARRGYSHRFDQRESLPKRRYRRVSVILLGITRVGASLRYFAAASRRPILQHQFLVRSEVAARVVRR
ncbi:hypothetical protein KCP76_03240 [Salmonella enterica subsp. enterica serovar Weltevreden]|nr:hypothetical protein KCP76_03240 [Salmonella enterica subsp. enterica serovar Weltevreden]